MTNDVETLRVQVDELRSENERLRKQLAETRAQRAEYMQYISELMPPVELPSEEEMAEQMKHLVPADQVFKELRGPQTEVRKWCPTRPRRLR